MFFESQWNCLIPMNSAIMLIVANYTIITVLSFVVLSEHKVNSLKYLNSNTQSNILFPLTLVLFFLNLAGIPPLPGFFIKLNLLTFIINQANIVTITILVIVNFTVFYLYIQFYKNINTFAKVRRFNVKGEVYSWTGVLLLTLLSFYPLYHLLTIFVL